MVHNIIEVFAEAGRMFFETFWPLVLGFTISGAVQAFAPRRGVARQLGHHDTPAVAKASLWGSLSSSCSYAAASVSKSLFAKGADFITAMIFMFAATNLVIELSIVLVVLLGWQFAAAQLLGGIIMVLLLALTGGIVVSAARSTTLRARFAADGTAPAGSSGDAGTVAEHPPVLSPWQRMRTRSGWSHAASYALSDAAMLKRELLIGYVMAAVLTVWVPVDVWHSLFWSGHGFWSSLENAMVAPLIAVVSFVCSIGNVPLAAALWHGGLSFAGVIAFIFADLITIPLLLVYRRYYGTAMMWRLAIWFYVVMVAAALIVSALFGSATPTAPAHGIEMMSTWANPLTIMLNVVFFAVAIALVLLARSAHSDADGPTRDLVCGMVVDSTQAPISALYQGSRYWFCSDGCYDAFTQNPGSFTAHAV